MTQPSRSVESFAGDEPVLVGAGDARPVFVALPAESVTARRLARLRELGRGMVVLALEDSIAERLQLPPSPRLRGPRPDLPFTASIDAARGVGDGWSLSDQALTMRVAADPRSEPQELAIPGHVHPIRVERDELLKDGGAASAALELARISHRLEAVALCAVVDRAGGYVTLEQARTNRALSRLPVVVPDELRSSGRSRRAEERAVLCALPTRDGDFEVAAYVDALDGAATVALVHGEPASHPRPSVYIHAACLLGDAFGSLLCDCRLELEGAVDRIVDEGAGIVVYVKTGAAPYACGRDLAVDAGAIAGLLHRVGVAALRLQAGRRTLATELRTFGLDVADGDLRSAA
jgi:3,4-dihydroxy 2-butanone 4-phosphate synthase / GTP cyclohydrolase II